MVELKRAEVRTEDGHQVIVLPEDIHIDGAEVYVEHNPDTGEITVRRERPEKQSAMEFVAFLDSLKIPQEDLDAWMVDRPMNVSLEPRRSLGDNSSFVGVDSMSTLLREPSAPRSVLVSRDHSSFLTSLFSLLTLPGAHSPIPCVHSATGTLRSFVEVASMTTGNPGKCGIGRVNAE